MDDPLKGKIFQSPQDGTAPQVPVQENPPQTPVFESPQEQQAPEPPVQPTQPELTVPPTPASEESQETVQPPSPEPQPEPVVQEPQEQMGSPDGSIPPRFSIGNIIKLLIGLFSIIAILLILFGVVLPNFNKKEEKVELAFWDISNDSTVSNILPDFEKQNPDIKVNLVKQDIKDYKDRLVTRIKNGTGPDIFRFHNTWVLELPDVLLPVPSDIITKDNFNKAYYPVVKHDLEKNGAIYGIPLEIDTLSLFVNSTLLADANVTAPTNWNDFITTARALTLKDQEGKIKIAGVGIGTFENVTHAPDIVSLLFAQDGINLDDISQNKQRVSDALNFYTAFALPDGRVWDQTLDPTLLAFSKGNLAMYFGYSKDRKTIKAANPNLAFDVVSVPHLIGQNQTIASYYPVGVSIKSKHQKEALLLLKFLSQKVVVDDSKGQAKDAVSSYFAGETFDNGLDSQMNTHLGNAINSILAGGTSDSAADALILGFSQVLKQFVPAQ